MPCESISKYPREADFLLPTAFSSRDLINNFPEYKIGYNIAQNCGNQRKNATKSLQLLLRQDIKANEPNKKSRNKQVISKQQLHVLHVFKSAMNTHFSFLLREESERISRGKLLTSLLCPGFTTQLHHSCYFSFAATSTLGERIFPHYLCRRVFCVDAWTVCRKSRESFNSFHV